ncbi:MAG: superoxide dismutase, Ni [Pseudomonadota bacterium]
MLHNLLKGLDDKALIGAADAHCDIPCGIYDPAPALIAALSVVRLMDIMHEAAGKDGDAVGKHNVISRCVLRKEEEAEKVKHEIRIIWGDYFKGPLLEKYPNIHTLAHNIMLKGSACKQEAHREDGEALVELVNQFAEAFWDSKGKSTTRKESPYAPAIPVVYPEL